MSRLSLTVLAIIAFSLVAYMQFTKNPGVAAANNNAESNQPKVPETYERFAPKDVPVNFAMTYGAMVYKMGKPVSISGSEVKVFTVGNTDIELVTNEVKLEGGHLIVTTKKFGKIRVKQVLNSQLELWVTPSQRNALLKAGRSSN